MMMDCTMGGAGGVVNMGGALLLAITLILAIAALVKYLVTPRERSRGT